MKTNLTFYLLLLLNASLGFAQGSKAKQPNVVIIMADDYPGSDHFFAKLSQRNPVALDQKLFQQIQ